MIRYAPRQQVGVLRFLGNVMVNAVSIHCCTQAFVVGIVISILSGIVEYLDSEVWVDFLADILPTEKVYTGLTATVGLMVVFYTSQAYNRYMSGIGLIYQIVGDFLDVTSLLMCFSKASKNASESDKMNFQDTLVRLFSIQFSVCLGHLEGRDSSVPKNAHNYEVIDPEGIDEVTMKTILNAEDKPSAVYQRILDLMMHGFNTGIISAPPPLYTRCFQELGNGMIKFHEALQFMEVPFPLPYMTITNVLIIIYTFLTPFFISSWSKHIWMAALIGFVPVFGVWLLLGVAEELDNPFNGDTIDLDSDTLIEDFNERLCALLSHRSLPPPCLSPYAKSMLPHRWRGHEGRTESQTIKTMADFLSDKGRGSMIARESSQDSGDLESGKVGDAEADAEKGPPRGSAASTASNVEPSDSAKQTSKGNPAATSSTSGQPAQGGKECTDISGTGASDAGGAVAHESGNSARQHDKDDPSALPKGSQKTPPTLQVSDKPEFQPETKEAVGSSGRGESHI